MTEKDNVRLVRMENGGRVIDVHPNLVTAHKEAGWAVANAYCLDCETGFVFRRSREPFKDSLTPPIERLKAANRQAQH